MSTWLNSIRNPSVANEPPSEAELSRNDIAVIITVLFALFLGWGIRDQAVGASNTIELGEGLPSIEIPHNWITDVPEGTLLQASNPRSPSIFNAEVIVVPIPLPAGQDTLAARTLLGIQRSQELLRYRELDAQAATVDGEPALLVTYAYVDDPSRDQGSNAPPVVVQAQDLIFASGENDEKVLVVTFATDAATWDEELPSIQMIQDSLDMEIVETEAVPDSEPESESDTLEEGGQ